MSYKLIKASMKFYPPESYNNRSRTEQRWNAEETIDNWQISIKNGKRLRRHWTRNNGVVFIRTISGEETVYNHQYNTASQPDDNPDFYSSPGYILS